MSAPSAVRHAFAGVALAALLLGVSACGTQNSAASASGGVAREPMPAKAGPASVVPSAANLGNTGNEAGAASVADQAGSPGLQQRAVISDGHISLTSSNLVQTRSRLDAVLVREGGEIADENTTTNQHGQVDASHLVVRVPGGRFAGSMTALSGIATLRSASRQAQDVTTRVIDLGARIKAEQAGVTRLERLVGKTADLRALLDVENALTQRQGVLESLRQQAAYLKDQTSLATISVDIALRTPAAPPPEHAAGGFLGGLKHGWNGLVAVVTGLLVGLGTLLPFAVAVLVLGLPTWLVVRRLRRERRPVAPPTAPAES